MLTREERRAENEAIFRAGNEAIVRNLDLPEGSLPLICECGSADCFDRPLPIGFEHVHNALTLYLRDRDPSEHLLYPKEARKRAMDPSSAHYWFKRCLKRAGLSTEWTPHDLRHAAADALYAVTGDIVLAQQLLRHADVRTTRGYLHPGLDRLAAAMKEVETEVVRSKDAG